MASRPKGRAKENVAGELYNSNAIDLPVHKMRPGANNARRQMPGGMPDLSQLMGALGGGGGMPDMSQLMGAMGGGGGMPDMGQMMEMMQKMGMGGGMPGMPGMPGMGGMPGMPPGMPGMPPGMMPPMMPMVPKAIYHGIPETTPTENFFTFYPNYINSKKTVQEGRRITKEAACEDPIAQEMSEVCQYFALPHVLELTKKYSRDWMVSGRVRVRLVKADGSFENPLIKTRKELMVKMAELIPKLASRKERLAKEAEEAANAANASSSASAAPASSSGSNKKKGKKKGKR